MLWFIGWHSRTRVSDWTELNWTYIMKWLYVQIYHTAVWSMLTHKSNKKWSHSMSSFLAILTFLLGIPGWFNPKAGKEHTERAQWAAKAPWSLTFTPFASSVHIGVLMILCSSVLCSGERSHIVPPFDNLKGTRLSNPLLWWKEAKKTKPTTIDGFSQHMQSLPWVSVPSVALQWSGVQCPEEYSVMMGLFKHLPCPASWHLATWRYWALEMWWV